MKLSYDIYLAVPPERVCNAITDSAWTKVYFLGSRVQSSFKSGEAMNWPVGGVQ